MNCIRGGCELDRCCTEIGGVALQREMKELRGKGPCGESKMIGSSSDVDVDDEQMVK
jgi:hypothetical protein